MHKLGMFGRKEHTRPERFSAPSYNPQDSPLSPLSLNP